MHDHDDIYTGLSEVEDTLWEMRTKWYHIGLQLGIDNETLKVGIKL